MLEILSFEEARIIGSLIEKELTTPEYYPLTVNALKNACNQKSNRNPVVSFETDMIENTLDALRNKSLVSRITGSDMRVPKYRQIFTEKYGLSLPEVAVISVLFLRGPQTPGEIKGRTERMFAFENLGQVDEVFQRLLGKEDPMIIKLLRQTGMKESRYAHLFSGEPDLSNAVEEETENVEDDRVKKLEDEVEILKKDLKELKSQFDELKGQLE